MLQWAGRDNIVGKFRHLAESPTADISPLYAALGPHIAEDEALLALAVRVRESQPPVNMLMASVQYLLMFEAPDDELARFYASLTEQPDDPKAAFPAFKRYCEAHAARLTELIETGVTNTNETGRSTVLMPAFALVRDAVGSAPLHMIEIGCSAGLNLNWDLFHYDYGEGRVAGPADSSVRLTCDLRQADGFPSISVLPEVASRRGIELNPVDLAQEYTRRWLQALIWPEQTDRGARLDAAIAIAQANRHPIHAGDASVLLPDVAVGLPDAEPVCVYHSCVFYQIPEAARQAIHSCLDRLAETRPVFRVAYEMREDGGSALGLVTHGESGTSRHLALCHPHGAWLEWLG